MVSQDHKKQEEGEEEDDSVAALDDLLRVAHDIVLMEVLG